MTRGVGGAEFARTLPEWVVALGGVVTQLGDAWFLLVVAGAVALGGRRLGVTGRPRCDGLVLFALGVGAYGLVTALKAVFGLPRPPGADGAVPPGWWPAALAGGYDLLVGADGFGFPSGHATAAAAVYGGAAALLEGDPRRRYPVAAALVVLVGASRVVIGVHYVVDVLAGGALGLLLAAGVVWLSRNRTSPVAALLVATGLGLAALALDPGVETVLATVGVALATVAWRWLAEPPVATAGSTS